MQAFQRVGYDWPTALSTTAVANRADEMPRVVMTASPLPHPPPPLLLCPGLSHLGMYTHTEAGLCHVSTPG